VKCIIKKVYYCDFCKKKGLRKDAIENHENHCTVNPNRDCGLCNNNIGVYRYPGEVATFKDERFIGVTAASYLLILSDIRLKTNNCPACILASIRELRARLDKTGVWFYIGQPEFDYAKESQKWLSEVYNENAQQGLIDGF